MRVISKNKTLELHTPQIMGILNFTPDSFSDGGQFNQLDKALAQAERMIEAGASIIDVGGESTRPGAQTVELEEELERVIPFVEALRKRTEVWISLDTSKAEVMRQGIAAGADIINDIRALTEPQALTTAAQLQVPVCIMHMQGQPQTMQQQPHYDNVFAQVSDFFTQRIQDCIEAGIPKEKIILDPGFGFGKTLDHNYELLSRLQELHQFELPILVGMSRKSMITGLLEQSPQEALLGSVVCASIAAQKGAHILRVHDVNETQQALRIVGKLTSISEETQ